MLPRAVSASVACGPAAARQPVTLCREYADKFPRHGQSNNAFCVSWRLRRGEALGMGMPQHAGDTRLLYTHWWATIDSRERFWRLVPGWWGDGRQPGPSVSPACLHEDVEERLDFRRSARRAYFQARQSSRISVIRSFFRCFLLCLGECALPRCLGLLRPAPAAGGSSHQGEIIYKGILRIPILQGQNNMPPSWPTGLTPRGLSSRGVAAGRGRSGGRS